MSKIGTQELKIPSNITLTVRENHIEIASDLGKTTYQINPNFFPEVTPTNQIKILPNENLTLNKQIKSLWGTEHRLLKNKLDGLSKGYCLSLTLKGVGFKASLQKEDELLLKLGYSHDVIFKIPKNIIIKCPKQDQVVIFGVNKRLVNKVAADLRLLKSKDPYKGKGILFEDEKILLKEGKKK